MRYVPLAFAAALASLPAPLAAQAPARLAEVEIERTRSCVDILSRLLELDTELGPLAERAQRLSAVAQAIALEDERVLDELDESDPVEARVRAWFVRDAELAQRYVATLAEELIDQRTAERDSIKVVVASAIAAIQEEGAAAVEASGNLPEQAAPCDGAIFVRPVAVEACQAAAGPLCEAARLPASEVTGFRFVDDPEAVWDITEVRPWSDPTQLGVNQQGQLDGARTIAYSRTGNVVVSIAFSPLLRNRADVSEEEMAAYEATNAALGISLDHPDVAIAPAMSLRATLPEPLAEETEYRVHFGTVAEEPMWSGAAGTGEPVQATWPLTPALVERLRTGEPITFSALRGDAAEPVFAVELATANQVRATETLLRYMAGPIGQDLARIVGSGASED